MGSCCRSPSQIFGPVGCACGTWMRRGKCKCLQNKNNDYSKDGNRADA